MKRHIREWERERESKRDTHSDVKDRFQAIRRSRSTRHRRRRRKERKNKGNSWRTLLLFVFFQCYAIITHLPLVYYMKINTKNCSEFLKHSPYSSLIYYIFHLFFPYFLSLLHTACLFFQQFIVGAIIISVVLSRGFDVWVLFRLINWFPVPPASNVGKNFGIGKKTRTTTTLHYNIWVFGSIEILGVCYFIPMFCLCIQKYIIFSCICCLLLKFLAVVPPYTQNTKTTHTKYTQIILHTLYFIYYLIIFIYYVSFVFLSSSSSSKSISLWIPIWSAYSWYIIFFIFVCIFAQCLKSNC